MSTWDRLVDYWKGNIQQNFKKVSIILGDMLTTLISLVLFVIMEGYAWGTAIIIIVLSMKPFLYFYLNLIFKGESELKEQENLVLHQKLEYEQELSSYRVLIAAKEGKVPDSIIAVYDWNELNRKIDELYAIMKPKEEKIYATTATDIGDLSTAGTVYYNTEKKE